MGAGPDPARGFAVVEADAAVRVHGHAEGVDAAVGAAHHQCHGRVPALGQAACQAAEVGVFRAVDQHQAVAAHEPCGRGGRTGQHRVDHHRDAQGAQSAHLLLEHGLRESVGDDDGRPDAGALHLHAAVAVEQHALAQVAAGLGHLAVDRQHAVAVLEAYLVHHFAEFEAEVGFAQRHVLLAPREQNHPEYQHGAHEVDHHAGHHYQQALPCRLGAELPGLGGLGEMLGVHRLVDHAGYLDVAAQRQPAEAVFGLAAPELEEREPRVEEEVELVDAGLEELGRDEVAELVGDDENRETQDELECLYQYVHD